MKFGWLNNRGMASLDSVGKLSCTQRKLWFADGFWYYRMDRRSDPVNITPLIRETLFQAAPLARRLGVGERTFHRLVKDSLGIPPGSWLRWERAVSARYRIKEGWSVKRLACEFGFSTPGDFTDEFKRWYEMSPMAYKSIVRYERDGAKSVL